MARVGSGVDHSALRVLVVSVHHGDARQVGSSKHRAPFALEYGVKLLLCLRCRKYYAISLLAMLKVLATFEYGCPCGEWEKATI